MARFVASMSPLDKDKRRPAGSTKGPPHIFRGGGSIKESTAPSTSSSSSSSTARNDVIAPPPRAQLTSSSPSPEEQSRPRDHGGNSESNGTPTPASRRSSNNAPHTRSPAATAASASAEATIREKDMRIAKLERELSVMEAEFQRELDKLSRSESETATFWQTKHSALNQQFLRTDTELRLLRDEVAAREANWAELTGIRWTLKAELMKKDEEIRDLRVQIKGLKEWVSTSTRADGSTSDEVFGEGMARLGNGLQNWVITNFRKAKIDFPEASEAALQVLAEFVPKYEELAKMAKIHLLQSLISRVLVKMVFHAYFVGLDPDQEQQLRRTEELMLSLGSSVESVNQWRSVILSTLKKESAQNMQAQTTQTADSVVTTVNTLLSSITTTKATTEARDQALRQLVNDAIDLSRLLVVQKAVFDISMPEIPPHQKVMFDRTTMEDIGGEDEESLVHGEICCVTFPGIIKRGDENGGHLRFRNVISKARVLCSPK